MNILRLLKDWTLPVAMTLGTLLYLLFAFTPALDGAAKALAPVFDAILPLFMFLILFVTFCKVDFHRLRPVAWHAWVAVAQIVLVATLMALTLGFSPTGNSLVLMEAVLCCVIGPTAAAAAVVTQKLGGQLEEMTTYTFIANFITAMLIPLCFPLIEPSHADFTGAFLRILHQVAVVLLVPMLMAYVVKHHLHRLHRRIVGIKDLSYYLWGVSLMIVTGTTVRNIVHASASLALLAAIAGMALLLCVVQFAVGRYAGHYTHRTVEAGQALGQKNTAFAIWVASVYLNPLSSVGPGCYILWQNIINSIEIWKAPQRPSTKGREDAPPQPSPKGREKAPPRPSPKGREEEWHRPHPQPLPLKGGEPLTHGPHGLPSLPLGIPKGDACYQRDARRGGDGGGVCNLGVLQR